MKEVKETMIALLKVATDNGLFGEIRNEDGEDYLSIWGVKK